MKDRNRIPATKRELLVRLLDLGKVMIHLDARRPGVDVPPEFRQDPDLRLNISYRFQHGDLTVGPAEVSATLSFSGHRYTCLVPIDAVFAMFSHVSGESFFFPTDAPPETLAGFAAMMASPKSHEEGGEESDEPRRRRVRRGPPRLRAIDGGARGPAEPASGETYESELETIAAPSLQAIEDEEPRTGWTAERGANTASTGPGDEDHEISESGDEAEQREDEATLVSEKRRFGHLRVVK